MNRYSPGTMLVLLVIGVVLIGGFLWGWPAYNVYRQEMRGKASFVRAVQDRRIKVLEASANLEAAALNAKAEIARAHGTNEANRIMATNLGGPENYLRWSYIHMLQETAGRGGREVIYLPTEAGMPILEASRMNRTAAPIPADRD